MAGQGNAAPVIIKRKKIVQGGGHFLQEDAPEELVRIILDHINRG